MVLTGLQRLVQAEPHRLAGRRVGLVTHPAAVLPDLTGAVEAMAAAGAQITALFGPEHGFDGAAPDATAVDHAVHPRLGTPIYSLYGAVHAPAPAMLADVDLLVFDTQDVGVRFYTFLSTLFHLLHRAGELGLPVLVLDRPNPINGVDVEGPLLEPAYTSFIGAVRVPIRHGMTLGELARFINGVYGCAAPLEVLPMQGWRRGMWFDATGLPWVATSPGIPQFVTTVVYPATCFAEGANLSEGRGTTLPFEVVGAPWLDSYRLAQTLNGLDLPGVRFRPLNFLPVENKYAGARCQGVQVHVIDRARWAPVTAGLDLLAGTARLREGIAAGTPVAELVDSWRDEVGEFRARREAYLLYR
jgi:uncharacterized protein YbbC (DUF1343 family)